MLLSSNFRRISNYLSYKAYSTVSSGNTLSHAGTGHLRNWNDIHQKIQRFPDVVASAREFCDQYPVKKDSATFITGTGDEVIGLDEDLRKAATIAVGDTFDVGVPGNHELDAGAAQFAYELDHMDEWGEEYLGRKPKMRYVATNLEVAEGSPLERHFYDGTIEINKRGKTVPPDKKIGRSVVIERGGNKWGFVGSVPGHFADRIPGSYEENGLDSPGTEESMQMVDREAQVLKEEKGVIAATHLSHMGLFPNIKNTRGTSFFDVNLTGHTHEEFNTTRLNTNGQPVPVTEAGRNAERYTDVHLKFYDNTPQSNSKALKKKIGFGSIDFLHQRNDGKTLAVFTTLGKTQEYEAPEDIANMMDRVLGPEKVIGELAEEYVGVGTRDVSNPLATFRGDAIRQETEVLTGQPHHVLIANSTDLVNEGLPAGPITDRDVRNISPFGSRLYTTQMTGEEIQQVLDWGAASLVKKSGPQKGEKKDPKEAKPGLIQGTIPYVADPYGQQVVRTNAIEPDETYNIVVDDYLLGAANFAEKGRKKTPMTDLLHNRARTQLEFNAEDAMIDYIEGFDGPFRISALPEVYSKKSRLSILWRKPQAVQETLTEEIAS